MASAASRPLAATPRVSRSRPARAPRRRRRRRRPLALRGRARGAHVARDLDGVARVRARAARRLRRTSRWCRSRTSARATAGSRRLPQGVAVAAAVRRDRARRARRRPALRLVRRAQREPRGADVRAHGHVHDAALGRVARAARRGGGSGRPDYQRARGARRPAGRRALRARRARPPRARLVRQVASPLRVDGAVPEATRGAFRGEHTETVLAELRGYAPETIAELRATGALGPGWRPGASDRRGGERRGRGLLRAAARLERDRDLLVAADVVEDQHVRPSARRSAGAPAHRRRPGCPRPGRCGPRPAGRAS